MHAFKKKNSKSKDASLHGSQTRRVESQSPGKIIQETTHLMEELTNHKASITENTKLLINGSEVLSKSGISGKMKRRSPEVAYRDSIIGQTTSQKI